jgi:hypothetical protein
MSTYNGLIVPDRVDPNLIISAFSNVIEGDKVYKYTRLMESYMLSHNFPPIQGYPIIINEQDIGEYFLNDEEIVESDIGKKAWRVTDGHHRSLAAISALLPYIYVELDYGCITSALDKNNF